MKGWGKRNPPDMRYQYQGTPATPPSPQLSLASGGITSAKAGTKYFWLQYRNRAGYSAVSASASVTVAAGQKIVVTIPTGAKPASVSGINGTDIHEYVILLATTNDVTEAVTVATFPGYQSDGTPYALPATIDLSLDQHLTIADLTVADVAALPASPVHGMRRAIASPSSRFVAYDAVFSPTGWKDVYPQVFSTYVADVTEINGCDVSIVDISDTAVILTPDYGVDGTESKVVGFWLLNDESNAIPSGTRIGISFDLDNVDVSGQFVGLASLLFQGYVTKTTGELDTAAMVVNTAVPYSGAQTGMVLQKNLPVGSAVFLQVRLEFRPFQLKNRPIQGSVLRVSPYLYADFAQYNADSSLLGSFIAAEYDRRRIVPDTGANSAIGLKGSGTISLSSGGGYTFTAVPPVSVIGLEADTADQNVFMAINGSLYVAGSTVEGAVLRAVIGTVNGLGHIKTWSGSYALTSSNLLQIIATYPLNISPDYPDVIAGFGAGYFNPSGIRFFVRPVGGGTIYSFDGVVLSGATQTFTIGLSGTETTVGSLPADPAAGFGLYRATDGSYAITSVSGSSVFSSGNYEVAIAFIFSDRVTSISHSTLDGCILEADTTIGDLFERTKYNRSPVTDLDALRSISSTTVTNLQKCIVADLKWEYQYQNDSYLVDDTTSSSYSAKPDDLTTIQAGRWIRLQRLGVGDITLGVDEYDYDLTLTDSAGIQNINLTIPRGVRGLRGFTGTAGDKGDPGTAGANTGVIITSSSPPSTDVNKIALYNDSNILKLRNASSGATEQIATLDRVQSFTRAQAITTSILTDSDPIAVDASASNTFRVDLTTGVGSTRVLENPTGLLDGQELVFLFKQPVVGGCDLTYDTKYRFVGSNAISLAASARSLITCSYDVVDDLLDCTVWGSGSGGGGSSANTLMAKTIAYWNLNESSGSRFDSLFGLELVDGASVVTSAAGAYGNAAVFYNTGGLLATVPSSFDISTHALSFSLIVKISNLAFGDATYGFTLVDTGQFRLYMDSSGAINLEVGTSPLTVTSAYTFPTGGFIDLTVHIDKLSDLIVLTVYSNAPEIFSGVGSETIAAFSSALNVGSFGDTLSIDELGFYSSRLTLAELSLLHNSGAYSTYPFS